MSLLDAKTEISEYTPASKLLEMTSASQTTPRPKRVAELDGLRAFAILPVILYHCYPRQGWFRWIGFAGEAGWIGVDLFFVLSGYLITGILLGTVDRPHYYRNFITRRTLRIFPLYYLCLVLFTVATKLSGSGPWEAMQDWGGVGWFVVYLGNIRVAWTGQYPPIFSFIPLWSLQVEEQFYLLYPLVIWLLARHNLRRFLVGCVVAAPVLRICLLLFVPDSGTACHVLTPCRMDALALGGLVAIIARLPSRLQPSYAKLRLAAAIGGAIALGTYVFAQSGFLGTSKDLFMNSIAGSLIDIPCAALLAFVVLGPSSTLVRVLRWRTLVYTGQIAYGLYLLHGPASWLARTLFRLITGIEIPGHSAAAIPLTFLASFVAAGLSWRYFESPILGLKDRFTIRG